MGFLLLRCRLRFKWNNLTENISTRGRKSKQYEISHLPGDEKIQ